MNNDERECPRAQLSEALRREVAGLPTSPAPVDAVVRAGRARRRRNRAVAGGAAALVVLAAVVGLPSLWGASSPDRVEPAVTAPASPRPVGSGVRTVRPYEPVALAPGLRLGLLPEGRQNYVVTEPERFPQALRQARSGQLGDNLGPRSVSVGYGTTGRAGVEHIDGAWRLPEPPRRIVVTAAGEEHRAELFTLPGSPGWGAYYLDTTGLPPFTSFTVTAYDEDGRAFDTVEVDVSLPGSGGVGS
ncbi:hypothetical protein [Streptomyces sp. NPDC057877]|uniref:hypothetical protein n=1 Tax=Streptomyces sp. NPDC057877 TaxID=3346269 RepID=UPI0036BEACAD